MTPKLQSALFAAAGFALGVASSVAACRQEPAARPPLVENVRGLVNATPVRALRPLAVRVGDDTARRATPAGDGRYTTVYLTVNGTPVTIWLEEDRP